MNLCLQTPKFLNLISPMISSLALSLSIYIYTYIFVCVCIYHIYIYAHVFQCKKKNVDIFISQRLVFISSLKLLCITSCCLIRRYYRRNFLVMFLNAIIETPKHTKHEKILFYISLPLQTLFHFLLIMHRTLVVKERLYFIIVFFLSMTR